MRERLGELGARAWRLRTCENLQNFADDNRAHIFIDSTADYGLLGYDLPDLGLEPRARFHVLDLDALTPGGRLWVVR